MRHSIERTTPGDALLAIKRLHAGIDKIEIVGRAIGEQRLRCYTPIFVRLERTRNGNGLGDEILQPIRAQVRRGMTRVAAAGINANAEILRRRVFDLLQVAVAVFELHVTTLACRRPGILRSGFLRKLNRLCGTFLEFS